MKLVYALVLLATAAVAGAQTAGAVVPGAEWERVDAKEAGFRSTRRRSGALGVRRAARNDPRLDRGLKLKNPELISP
ncbi:MAG TPA: hypothetical protein VLI71_03590 [Gammaproteobacteria bacterium]|nr:hypothetical protein [Gammaproteobacteria bacterium]